MDFLECPIPLSKIALAVYRLLLGTSAVAFVLMLIRLERNYFSLRDDVTNASAHLIRLPGKEFTRNLFVIYNQSPQKTHSVFRKMPSLKSCDIPAITSRKRPPSEEFSKFVVYDPKCQIPDYPPFHEDVGLYYKKMPPINCSSKPLLTFVTHFDDFTYVLNLHKDNVGYYVNDGGKMRCCYSLIHCDNKEFKIGDCETFENNVTLVPTADLVFVNCTDENNVTVYKFNHFLVPIKDEVRRKMERFDSETEELMSVMIVGLDSVSRLNLLRTMPETVAYLEKTGWFTFPAYHRIKYNTFHNLVGPILTGHEGKTLLHGGAGQQACWPDDSDHVDNCPYIWKNYSSRNYITAYGEDDPRQDSFTTRSEFKTQPTDFYLKPLLTSTEIAQEVDRSGWASPRCIGPVTKEYYILSFSADFARTFVNYPTFSLFWLNTAHEDLNAPQTLDRSFIEFFGNLNSSGALDRTMVVFMSDHGLRLSNFRLTPMGFVEAAMPFLYVWLPGWFRRKYPEKEKNMGRNKYRLVSHFDLHLTLMNVLGVNSKAPGCPKCVSLFDLVLWNRGCSDAGVKMESCACDSYVPIEPTVEELANHVAAYFNTQAALYSPFLKTGYKCAQLTVKTLRSARRVLQNERLGNNYILHLVMSPKDIPLEVFISDTKEVYSVTHIAQYGPYSYCMDSREGKQFCVCEPIKTLM